jgi:prepilin-type processing-associated H-X9-DG protein
MAVTKPLETEYAPHFHTYISKVPHNNLSDALHDSHQKVLELLKSIPEEKYNYRYAEGKWTIKEIVAHLIDCERIFVYRALTFARKDKSELPGFDEEEYTPESNASNRSMQSLMREYEHLRKSNILFFDGLTEEMSMRKGIANGKEISVRALGFAISGHELHHMQVIRERYL